MESKKVNEPLPWDNPEHDIMKDLIENKEEMKRRHYNNYNDLYVYDDHFCSLKCVCPIHGKEFFYSPREKLHACQDPTCEFAHGFENVSWDRIGR